MRWPRSAVARSIDKIDARRSFPKTLRNFLATSVKHRYFARAQSFLIAPLIALAVHRVTLQCKCSWDITQVTPGRLHGLFLQAVSSRHRSNRFPPPIDPFQPLRGLISRHMLLDWHTCSRTKQPGGLQASREAFDSYQRSVKKTPLFSSFRIEQLRTLRVSPAVWHATC